MMNEESDKQIESEAPSDKPLPKTSDRRTVPLVAVAAIAIVGIVAIAAWLLWPKQVGKPVPAPRSVSFEESPQNPKAGEQKLTLTPEQMRTAQLKIETVGERPSSEAAGQIATGVSLYAFAWTTPVAICPAASDDGRSPTVSIFNCAVRICSAVSVNF